MWVSFGILLLRPLWNALEYGTASKENQQAMLGSALGVKLNTLKPRSCELAGLWGGVHRLAVFMAGGPEKRLADPPRQLDRDARAGPLSKGTLEAQ